MLVSGQLLPISMTCMTSDQSEGTVYLFPANRPLIAEATLGAVGIPR